MTGRRLLELLLVPLLAWAMAACSDDSTGRGSPDVDGGSDLSDVIDDTADLRPDAADTADTVAPVISASTLTENPANALSAFIELETDEDAVAWAVADDGEGHVVETPPTTLGTDHEIWLVGLRADGDYDVTVWAEDAAGNQASDDSLSIATTDLPADVPPMERVVDNGGGAGVTMLSVFRWTPDFDDSWSGFFGVDQEGEVVWYHFIDAQADDFRRLDNGNFLFVYGNRGVREINLMGRTVNDWPAADLSPAVDTLHHEAFPLADGNLLVLSTELRTIAGYPDPDNEGETVSYDVVGDLVVEVDLGSGDVLDSVGLLDVLEDDQLRTNGLFHAPFWDNRYASEAPNGTKDWSHGNAVIYDETTNLVMVSARTLSWVVAYDRDSGELAWRLGCDGDFELTNGSSNDETCHPEWQYSQHAPEVQADGSLLIFDNGNVRPGTGGDGQPAPYSRAVIFSYDDTSSNPDDWTATVEWEFTLDEGPDFAPIIGDADRLGDGNVLLTFGGLVDDPSGDLFEPTNRKSARVVEVTGDASPEVTWELQLRDPTPDPVDEDDPVPNGYHVYRAERLPNLYGFEEE